MSTKINKLTLSEQIYLALKKDIVLNKLPFNKKLTIKDVQDMYEVSSTPVREALTKLANDGLVTLIANKGVTINDYTLEDSLEIQEVAFLLDYYALKYAMEHASRDELIKTLKNAIIKHKEIDINDDESVALTFYENYFHNALYEFVDNKKIIEIKEKNRIEFAVVAFKARATFEKENRNEDHQKIVNAIINNNKDLALELLKDHFESGKKSVIEFYKQNKKR
ncbi:MAG: GntR family transcriptional regulator [Bacilli bacterium]|jgi:DNA-binding GntR family transcriptional regulator|nr:GntR family transcriptional regulator [Bacilli bacterium]